MTHRQDIIDQAGNLLDAAGALLDRAARFRIPSAGPGFALDWRHSAIAALIAQVADLTSRWQGKLADFDARIAAYDQLSAGTSDDARFGALRAAKLIITTSLGPLPASPAQLRTDLNATRARTDAAQRL